MGTRESGLPIDIHRGRGAALAGALSILAATTLGCRAGDEATSAIVAPATASLSAEDTAFLDDVEHRAFRFFWETTPAATGLAHDRWPTESFSSVAAVGFALSALPIGAERGWVAREDALGRALATLRYFYNAPQDSSVAGAAGYHGLFYHFLDRDSGLRFRDVELSTVDTALFLAGALFCGGYFDRDDPAERELRALVDSIDARVDWNWASPRPPLIGHGWSPEEGPLPYDWGGFNEAMILYVIALGSPTHAPAPESWAAWCAGYKWGVFEGREHLGFAPLFGHQYSHCWIDFRGIQDAATREHGLDYFENSRRATLAQRDYAIRNPGGWAGYGETIWGLSACDGPFDGTISIGGREREFHTYWARGASFTYVNDDGTIAPTAAAGSIAFAPEVVVPALKAMRDIYGARLFGEYGFFDSFNPTLNTGVDVHHGVVDAKLGWFDTDYLGIDQGPILLMIENFRSQLVWRTMRSSPRFVRGLRAAGFTGGWLDSAAAAR